MDKPWHCIQQFGTTGEAYFNQTVFLGEMCLFPNFCHEPSTYKVVRKFVDTVNSLLFILLLMTGTRTQPLHYIF